MKAKRLISIILTIALVLSLPAGVFADENYDRRDDDSVYDRVLGEFARLVDEASATYDIDERFVRYARAEAELLNSGALLPMSSSGANYAITHIAPHSVPVVMYGTDSYRYGLAVAANELITAAERAEMIALWEAAAKGQSTYDPASYLLSKGHTLNDEVMLAFSTELSTLDWSFSNKAEENMVYTNIADSLVHYDRFGKMVPAAAASWTVSSDGCIYTFTLRDDIYWYTADGQQYAKLTAADYERGFKNSLDGLQGSLTNGIVAGVQDYHNDSCDLNDVGVKATGDNTLQITLERPVPYFMSLLTYTCFYPVCTGFETAAGDSFALSNSVYNQVYCGPFLLKSISDQEIVLEKNEAYYDAASISVDKIRMIKSTGEDPMETYNLCINGQLSGCTLNGASMAVAVENNVLDTYGYKTDLNSNVFYATLNLNRGRFDKSEKTEAQKISYAKAVNNINFRKAVMHAVDKGSYSAVVYGEENKNDRLVNTITPYYFVTLSNDVTVDGASFKANTPYGEILQYYLDKLGCEINTAPGMDGTYKADAAAAYLARAAEELGDEVTYPIMIDAVYITGNSSSESRAQKIKQSIESTLGSDKVTVNLVAASDANEYYSWFYYIEGGKDLNLDFSDGSGWGPDYADPSTYIDIFRKNHGMSIQFGLTDFDGYDPEPFVTPDMSDSVDADGETVIPEVDEETVPEIPITPKIASQVIKNVVIAVEQNDQTVLNDVPKTVDQEELEDTPAEELSVVWQKDIKVPPATKFPVTISFNVPEVKDWQEVFVYHFTQGIWQLVGSGKGSQVDATFSSLSPVAVIVKNTPKPAENYDLWVGGVQINNDIKDDITAAVPALSGSVSFDPATSTLTLNNAVISGGSDEWKPYFPAVISSKLDTLNIVLIGENVIDGSDAQNDGIDTEAGCSLTISGGGSLVINNAYYGIYVGEYVVEGADLLIKDSSVTVNQSQAAGIWVNHDVTLENSTVYIDRSEQNNYSGIVSNIGGTITVDGSDLTIINDPSAILLGNGDDNVHSMVINNSNVKLTSTSDKADYGYAIMVEPDNNNGDINASLRINSGTIDINSVTGASNIPQDSITIDGSLAFTKGSSLADVGNVVISKVASSASVTGDVNGDNEIDANDLTALSRHVAQIELITDAKLLLAADTDGSGSISADDLTVLSRYVAQIIKEFPEPNIEEYEVSMCPDDVHLG